MSIKKWTWVIVTPFLYPKEKHVRKLTPKSYSNYKQYKSFLQEEFGRKCVYCRMPDTWGPEGFGVDHYRPKKYFPELVTNYSNLYYCCNQCNSRKGSYWPESLKAMGRMIPNPCDHRMHAHLRYSRATVESKTKAGSFTKELLDLNAPDVVKRRELMLNLIQVCETTKMEFKSLEAAIKKKHACGAMSLPEAESAMNELDSSRKKMDDMLFQLRAGD